MKKNIDSKTVRELTERHQNDQIKFRKMIMKDGEFFGYSGFDYEGKISHAIDLTEFAVWHKNKILFVCMDDMEFINRSL
jgi:hypothetical protein